MQQLDQCSDVKLENEFSGYHAMIDGVSLYPTDWTPMLAHDFLIEMVELADMKLIAGPVVTREGQVIAGIAVLAESHASVHLNVASGAAHIDLFSCKKFDTMGLDELARTKLRLLQAAHNYVERNTSILRSG